MSLTDRAAALVTLCTLVGLWLGWLKVLRPRARRLWRRVDGALDTLGGRPPIVDNESGRELAPALPPLGERLATMEDALVRLATTSERMDEESRRLDTVTEQVGDLTRRVTVLETSSVERIAAHAESAQMWRAVAERDTDVVPTDD